MVEGGSDITRQVEMEKIAVALDGSEAAASALRWAVDIAKRSNTPIVGVNALYVAWGDTGIEQRRRRTAEQQERVEEEWLAPATESGVATEAVVGVGDPREVVLTTALSAGADLVVMGRTGSGGGPGFLHLGSVAEHAAHHTTLPLAVIPTEAPTAIRTIVVGVDGSAESLRALAWAGDVARSVGADVVAVQVMEPLLEWTPASSPDNWRRDVERDLREWALPLTDAGVSVTAVAQRNLHPADGLLGVATTRGADLLVVGARGLGGFKSLRVGGVALKVLHRVTLPLVLVPPA